MVEAMGLEARRMMLLIGLPAMKVVYV